MYICINMYVCVCVSIPFITYQYLFWISFISNLHTWPIPGADLAQGGAPSMADVLHGVAQGVPDGNGNGSKGKGKAKAKAKAKAQPGGKGQPNANGENGQPESLEPTTPLQKAKTLARSVLLGSSIHYVLSFYFHHRDPKSDHTILDDLGFI